MFNAIKNFVVDAVKELTTGKVTKKSAAIAVAAGAVIGGVASGIKEYMNIKARKNAITVEEGEVK